MADHVGSDFTLSLFSLCSCVCPGLLLLCMVASEVWDAETKPIDFVCNRATRRAMNIVAEMESSDCNGVMTLSTPVQLPCTELHVASWKNKSVCWHMYESKILYYSNSGFITCLAVYLAVRALSHPGCVASLLQKLENNINNYLLILTHLQLSVRSCHGYKLTLLLRYKQLISGKLEQFMINLEDSCTYQ
uniref:Zmp:0000001268 n=1 Tax=Seriola dumerili TaxID=41447 RepID=A0A3B4U0Y5_SERDU